MKQLIKITILSSVLAASSMYASCFDEAKTAHPYFSIRSQSTDSARDLVGLTHKIHLNDYEGCWYGVLSATGEYTRSFRSERIARCLFGPDLVCGCPDAVINVTGSRVADRDFDHDWLADYFGLPTDFRSKLKFSPKVDNVIVDLDLFIGFSRWCENLFFRVNVPVVYTRWDLNFCEEIVESGINSYDEGYFAPTSTDSIGDGANNIPRENLLNNAKEFFCEGKTPNLNTTIASGQGSPKVAFKPLEYSKFSCCRNDCECYESGELKLARVSDIQLALGWDFYHDEKYHLGVMARAAAPSGRKPRGCFLFEPIVGNGGHWEVGAGLTSHYTLWESDCEDRSIGFYFDANLMHLFKARQRRSFDLCNRPNSRYMLAERMKKPVDTLAGGDSCPNAVPADAQFQNVFTPIANLTTFDVNVSSRLQADITGLLNFTRCNWSVDVGYNFWARTCETIRLRCDCPTPLESGDMWAVKGDSYVYACQQQTTGAGPTIALSATQQCANIHGGKNFTKGTSVTDAERNPGVDNPEDACSDGSIVTVNCEAGSQQRTSIQPKHLSNDDIDLRSARTRGMSHKIFGYLGYNGNDCGCWTPYFGVGLKGEWSPLTKCREDVCSIKATSECDTTCSPCTKVCQKCPVCNLSEWGIWFKGGVSFN